MKGQNSRLSSAEQSLALGKTVLVQGRVAGRIAQCNELSRRVIGRCQRSVWIRVDNRQHFTAANSPDRQALTLHGKHSVRFAKDSDPAVAHRDLDAPSPGRDSPVLTSRPILFPFWNKPASSEFRTPRRTLPRSAVRSATSLLSAQSLYPKKSAAPPCCSGGLPV